MAMENEKHNGWNECNKNIFCSIEADDDSVDRLDGDTNNFNSEYSMRFSLSLLQLCLNKIKYHMKIHPASC